MIEKPLCSIYCLTYNHRPYIAQALESFIAQKTNFPYEVVIGDDGSDDGTTEICAEYARKYPDLIRHSVRDRKTSLSYNHTALYNSICTTRECRGKYISNCNGDDFYPTPDTIQLQIDFLESHPDYGMVHGITKLLMDDGKEQLYINNIPAYITGNIFREFFVFNLVMNCSSCCRSEFYQQMTDEKERDWSFPYTDRYLWLIVSSQSKIGYIPRLLATYRINRDSITHNGQFEQTTLKYARTQYTQCRRFIDHEDSPFTKEELILFYLRRSSVYHNKFDAPKHAELYRKHYRKKLLSWMSSQSCFVPDALPVRLPE